MFSPRPLALATALVALVSIASAQTGVPVVSQISDLESYVDAYDGSQQIRNLALAATNSPTQFHVTGLPPNVSVVDSGPQAGLSWYDAQLTGGKFTVTVTADNAAGTSAPMTFHWTIHPSQIGSTVPDKNTYYVGDTVTLTVKYSAPVVASAPPDDPYIYLWNGKQAKYASGSGTATLTFTYVVTADDTSVSNFVPGSVNTPLRSIATADGVSAGAFSVIPPGSSRPVINVVGSDPDTITGVSCPTGTYSGAITFTAAYTHNVTITGTPVMHLTVNGVARTAAFTSIQDGSGSVGVSQPCYVNFQYVPSTGDNGSVVLDSPIDLNGGSITSLNGTPAVLTFDASTVTGVNVDTTPSTPVITGYDATSSTPSFQGRAAAGVAISVFGGATTQTTTAAADGTWQTSWTGDPLPPGTYDFRAYAVDAAGHETGPSNGVTVTVAPTSVPVVQSIADQEMSWHFYRHDEPQEIHVTATNAPTRFDATGVPPGITFFYSFYNYTAYGGFRWTYGGLGGGKYNVTVTATNSVGTSDPVSFQWIIHPGMTDFLTTDKHQYAEGDLITFTAKFSAPVVVSGTPYIQLWGTKKALYAGGSGTSTLTFTYRVAADDPAASGLYYNTITAGDGTIETRDGISADLTDSYVGLGDIPTFSVIPANQPASVQQVSATWSGHTVQIALKFNAALSVTGTPLVPLSINGVARSATMQPGSAGGDTLIFQYTPQPGDNGSLVVQSPIDLNGGSITGGNGLPVDTAFTPYTSTLIVDTTPPNPPAVNWSTSGGTLTFSGTTESNAYVYLQVPSKRPVLIGRADANGAFAGSWIFGGLPPGSYPISLVATDISGNTSAASTSVTVTAAYPTKPATPVINSVDSFGRLSGTADPGSRISIYAPDWFPGAIAATTDTNGTWTTSQSYTYFVANSDTLVAVAYDAANSASDQSAPFTISSSPAAAAPVVSNATLSGQVGTPIAQVQLQATNSPTSFSADAALGNYGLQLSGSGVISGTPTQAASGVAISFTASNAAGTSAAGTLTLNITPASTTTTPPPTTTPPSTTKTDPTITFASPTAAIRVGQPITLGAISSAGLPVTYSVVNGNATISGNVLTALDTTTLVVRAATAATDSYNAAYVDVNFGSPIPVATSRLVNISSRVRVSGNDADGATIAGFVITGSAPKQILIRAVGPSLAQFKLGNLLPDPTLTLYDNSQAVVATNGGWNGNSAIASAGASVGAFALLPGSKDAALLVTLNPGPYTARVQSANSGTALIEVYDIAAGSSVATEQLINISTRGHVGTDQDVLIGGFVVSGDAPKQVLVRAVGPGLTRFQVSGILENPSLQIYDAKQNVVAQNADWGTPQPLNGQSVGTAAQIAAAASATGAFSLASGSKDAAVLITLAPGAYTAIVSGENGQTGSALVEVYEVPAAGGQR